jgi:hypothetical protein
LNLGRKDRVTDDEIRALLSADGEVDASVAFEIMHTHTYLNVPEGDAQRWCETLGRRVHGQRQVICERARPPR